MLVDGLEDRENFSARGTTVLTPVKEVPGTNPISIFLFRANEILRDEG